MSKPICFSDPEDGASLATGTGFAKRRGNGKWRFSVRAVAHLVVATCLIAPALAQRYHVVDLGTLPGQAYSWDWQQTINNRGVVAAYANNILDPDAFSGDLSYLWSNGTIIPLPGLPGATDTVAFAINDFDQVVGRSTRSGQSNSPVLWDGGKIHLLPELPGDNKGAALMISNAGEIVGYSANTNTGVRRAAVWSCGNVSQLPPLPGGGIYDEALGVNTRGEAVGWSGSESGLEHITLWKHGKAFDLGTLGGTWGDAYAINEKGEIVGLSATAAASGNPDAFLWRKGKLIDLGNLGGDVFGEANGINDDGDVAGFSGGDPNDLTTWHALLWKNGALISLQDRIPANSGWTLLAASGINNNGQINGVGIHNGKYRAFLLSSDAY